MNLKATVPSKPGLPYALAVRERRVLVPIARRCPFGCRYCYADDVTITPTDDVDLAVVVAAVVQLDPSSYDVIQLGYDGDPIASSSALRQMLPGLAATGKHINISTKGTTTAKVREFLGDMHRRTPAGISLNVSATCWDSAPTVEPRTPSPPHRLRSASLLYDEQNIPFVLSLRPLLPSVRDDELHTLLESAHASGALAAVTGPLYVQPDGRNMTWTSTTFEHVAPSRVSWSPAPLHYRRVEDPARVEKLKTYSESIGLPLYRSNADALRQLMARTNEGTTEETVS